MARTTEMRLIEMMILKEDISNVVEYLGHSGEFQLQSKRCADTSSAHGFDPAKADGAFFGALQKARAFLALPDREEGRLTCPAAKEEDREDAVLKRKRKKQIVSAMRVKRRLPFQTCRFPIRNWKVFRFCR